MRINEKKFYELAKEAGFTAAELYFSRNYELKIETFHDEISSFNESDSASLLARGIVDGRFGAASTEQFDAKTPQFLIDSIKATAKVIEKDDPSIIFEGSKKYHKKNLYNPDLIGKDRQKKISDLHLIEKKLRAYDPRIVEVQTVIYQEGRNETVLSNSHGLKLKNKDANYAFYAAVVAKEGSEIKTGDKLFAGRRYEEFDVDRFVHDAAEDALKKLGGTQCLSGRYPVVLNPKTAGWLAHFYLRSAVAEDVQKKSSLFIDKLDQPVASKKITIIEDPLIPNLNYTYFDDEGVATYKKPIIKNGVLKTYLYNLTSAQKDGVVTTANAKRGAARIGTTIINPVIRPGRKSEAELIASIKEGVYITELEGLHAGMNARSGNFSLQAQGFMIRDGQLAEPLALITLAGTLPETFLGVKAVANNLDLNDCLYSGVLTPSLLIKSLSVSGK